MRPRANAWVMTVFLRLSSSPSPALLLPTARWALLSCTLYAVWASTERPVPTVPTCGAFATPLLCGVLLNWYSQGMDVNKLLPHLSVYLGHAKPQNTYWYLTATPDLLSKAGSRFESYANQRGEL